MVRFGWSFRPDRFLIMKDSGVSANMQKELVTQYSPTLDREMHMMI